MAFDKNKNENNMLELSKRQYTSCYLTYKNYQNKTGKFCQSKLMVLEILTDSLKANHFSFQGNICSPFTIFRADIVPITIFMHRSTDIQHSIIFTAQKIYYYMSVQCQLASNGF